MKKFISVILMALLVATLTFPAFAAEPPASRDNSIPIHSDYVNIRLLQAGLAIDSSGRASCTGRVTLYSSSNTANLTLALQKYTGSGWSTIKTWTASARGTTPTSVVKFYYVARGQHRVSTTAKIYNSSGTLLETQIVYSATKNY